MGFERKISCLCLIIASLGANPAVAAPATEPLIVTRLADPDPNYVPPPAERHAARMGRQDESPTLDSAMQDFGRAIGQAAILQQQAIEARCNSGAPVPSGGAARWAWEANCRYQRH
jgi:hypothetical protein